MPENINDVPDSMPPTGFEEFKGVLNSPTQEPSDIPFIPASNVAETPELLRQRLAAKLQATYDMAIDEVKQRINDRLNKIQSVYDFHVAEIAGPISLKLDRVQKVLENEQAKIIKAIGNRLQSAYTYSQMGGLPIPSTDAIRLHHAMGDEDPLPYNFIGVGPYGPYSDNWPEEILGPKELPSRVELTLAAMQQQSGGLVPNAPFVGDGVDNPNPPYDGNGNGVCPPGFIPAILPDGTLECNPPEYAYQPPSGGTNPPPFTPPILPPFERGNGLCSNPEPRVGWTYTGKTMRCQIAGGTMFEITHPTVGIRWIQDWPPGAGGQPVSNVVWFHPEQPYPILLELIDAGEQGTYFNYRDFSGACQSVPCGTASVNVDNPPPPTDSCPVEVPRYKGGAVSCRTEEIARCRDKILTSWLNNRDLMTPEARAYYDMWLHKQITTGELNMRLEIIAIRMCDPEDPNLPPPPTVLPGTSECTPLNIKPIDWCNENAPLFLHQFVDAMPKSGEEFAKLFCVYKEQNGSWHVNGMTRWAVNNSWIPWKVPNTMNSVVNSLLVSAYEVIVAIADENNPNSKAALVSDGILTLAKTLNRWIGFPPDSWLQKFEYSVNALVPVMIPSAAEIHSMYQSDVIEESTFKTLVSALNLCPDWQMKVAQSQRARPDVFQTVDLFRRGLIDQFEFSKRMRALGVLNDRDEKLLLDLGTALPGIADVIRFMVRDVADPSVVQTYTLDAEFGDKFQGKLVEFSDALGIPIELARYYWRAHWEFPSPTQLYEMLHRLRPGAVDPSVEVTPELVAKTLGINDYNPFWQQRMMAVSYSPLTRVDTQRAFFIDAIDEDQLKSAYMDGGYDEKNANILVEFTKRLKVINNRNAAGLPGPKDYIRDYVNGIIGIDAVQEALFDFGWSTDRVSAALDGARYKRMIIERKSRVASIKNRFLKRVIDKFEAVNEMLMLELDDDTIVYNIGIWEDLLSVKRKAVSASQLCQFFERGLVNASEYVSGLARLGYSPTDISDIISLCSLKVDDKRRKEAERIAKQIAGQIEKARKEQEKQRRDAAKAEEKRIKEEEKRKKEEEKLMKEEEKCKKKFGIDEGEVDDELPEEDV